MSSPKKSKTPIVIISIIALSVVGYFVIKSSKGDGDKGWLERKAAVAVASVEQRPIELRRMFSGALEAHSKFVVAPKVAGRVKEIPVDIADLVHRGEAVAILEAAEFEQAVRQAEADLAVAEANLAEATSSLEITLRANQRTTTLRERGIASETEYDNVQAQLLAREAKVKVAEAQVIRAESSLESARIRLGYTQISADWLGDQDERYVAERYVDEGETVTANEPLLMIVDLDPITAVIYVTERDYSLLSPDQTARFTTDAFPDQVFQGKIERISPIFRERSRQARVELSLENPEGRLKPGMFVRAETILQRVEEATVIPFAAITRRGSETGVFLVSEDRETVSWEPVQTGIRSDGDVQLINSELEGEVVILGQHLLEDGSKIAIPEAVEVDIK
ncbi:efflux RND transporter periplasmic adaptor subunit [Pelagicoccus mobilis]|uniref:Efflux RND transporter periplasmic adaptor subunit n=1 Tax=Pelagicoccus mobilis TaxID=415221 RepID=A0A934RYT0_9BACT|nr:efflux RND transporter periplasmic adaptor subunit [Pelagicoccus mobilis]MBK1877754.1 efflux RND transporter periplasmic adaptor subunit [Pelagicoccus mobilis]